ncbi:hypothetical protein CHS0354_040888 [Potamilus streckersoni]|uniref:Uncharacterized protein n=1 Tax=Potamilus streckersoni TaxID=2493646 RepID=A0AAE0SM81_9BIVA|nr:hypothetical protein CHS0354_040888 [Potamilus streckersoni]
MRETIQLYGVQPDSVKEMETLNTKLGQLHLNTTSSEHLISHRLLTRRKLSVDNCLAHDKFSFINGNGSCSRHPRVNLRRKTSIPRQIRRSMSTCTKLNIDNSPEMIHKHGYAKITLLRQSSIQRRLYLISRQRRRKAVSQNKEEYQKESESFVEVNKSLVTPDDRLQNNGITDEVTGDETGFSDFVLNCIGSESEENETRRTVQLMRSSVQLRSWEITRKHREKRRQRRSDV